ncbi:Protein Arginine N-Methyltransferase 9 [Manis pentadactyla]|nr:Protein Arginine N-Methyltransferase 9 [Manis pentadactyla]
MHLGNSPGDGFPLEEDAAGTGGPEERYLHNPRLKQHCPKYKDEAFRHRAAHLSSSSQASAARRPSARVLKHQAGQTLPSDRKFQSPRYQHNLAAWLAAGLVGT